MPHVLTVMIAFAIIIVCSAAQGNILEKFAHDPVAAMNDVGKDLVLGTTVIRDILPSPVLDLSGTPQCSILLSTRRIGGTGGVCSSYGTNFIVPQRYFYSDIVIDIQSQCVWHDGCYTARRFGGKYTKKQCDDLLYKRLLDECRRKVGHCSSVLSHCANNVHRYYRMVQEFGGKAWSKADGDRPSDQSVFGPAVEAPLIIGGRVETKKGPRPHSGKLERVYIESDRTVFTLTSERLCPDGHYIIEGSNPRLDDLTNIVIQAKAFDRTVFLRGVHCQAVSNGRAIVTDMYVD